jgi:hypothetical protein
LRWIIFTTPTVASRGIEIIHPHAEPVFGFEHHVKHDINRARAPQ